MKPLVSFVPCSMYLKCPEPFRALEWKWISSSLVILSELVYVGIDSWAAFICKLQGCSLY